MPLSIVDDSIIQDIRYASSLNFTGAPIDGYETAECYLVDRAAFALRNVQNTLRRKGLGLKVFDCYRPTRAVAAFMRWSARETDQTLKRSHYPRIKKTELVPMYIAGRSGHSRGASVDLTLVRLSGSAGDLNKAKTGTRVCNSSDLKTGAELDMGTSFDCFDRLSRTNSTELGKTQQANRAFLVDVMRKHGFRNYSGEWWHFSLFPEPYPKTYFNFPVREFRHLRNDSEN